MSIEFTPEADEQICMMIEMAHAQIEAERMAADLREWVNQQAIRIAAERRARQIKWLEITATAVLFVALVCLMVGR